MFHRGMWIAYDSDGNKYLSSALSRHDTRSALSALAPLLFVVRSFPFFVMIYFRVVIVNR